jgi:hypothetical protein
VPRWICFRTRSVISPAIRIKQKSDASFEAAKIVQLVDRTGSASSVNCWRPGNPPFLASSNITPPSCSLWSSKRKRCALEFVLRLDWAYGQKGLSKTERRYLRDLLSDLAGELANESDNAEMKALYSKYVGVDFDQEEAEMMAEMKAMMEHELGMDLGDDLDMELAGCLYPAGAGTYGGRTGKTGECRECAQGQAQEIRQTARQGRKAARGREPLASVLARNLSQAVPARCIPTANSIRLNASAKRR